MTYDATTEWEDIQVKLGNFIPTKVKVNYHQEDLKFIEKNEDFLKDNNFQNTPKLDENMDVSNDKTNLSKEAPRKHSNWEEDDEIIKEYQSQKYKMISELQPFQTVPDSIGFNEEYKFDNNITHLFNQANLIKNYEELETNFLNFNAPDTTGNSGKLGLLFTQDNSKFKNKLIFIYLYQPHIEKCVRIYNGLLKALNQLNEFFKQQCQCKDDEHKENKHITNDILLFYKMVATDCVTDYEEVDVPGLLVYLNGKIVEKFVPFDSQMLEVKQNKKFSLFQEIVKALVSSLSRYFYPKEFNERKTSESKENINLEYNKDHSNYVKYKKDQENSDSEGIGKEEDDDINKPKKKGSISFQRKGDRNYYWDK